MLRVRHTLLLSISVSSDGDMGSRWRSMCSSSLITIAFLSLFKWSLCLNDNSIYGFFCL